MNKKTYSSPDLIVYGTVGEITQATGDPQFSDAFFLNNQPIGLNTTGSNDYHCYCGSGGFTCSTTPQP